MNQTVQNLMAKEARECAYTLAVSRRYERGFFGAPKSVAISAVLSARDVSAPPLPIGEVLFRLVSSEGFRLKDIASAEPGAASPELVNLRGRPPESFHELDDPPAAGEEEILYVEGRVIQTSGAEEDEQVEELFKLSLRTEFSRFIGSRQIVYALKRHQAPQNEAWMTAARPIDLGWMMPLKLTQLRLGFELFVPRFVGSFLGIAPIIKTRFYLDLSSHKLNLFTEGELENGFPAGLAPEVDALSGVLARAGIYPDFGQALRQS